MCISSQTCCDQRNCWSHTSAFVRWHLMTTINFAFHKNKVSWLLGKTILRCWLDFHIVMIVHPRPVYQENSAEMCLFLLYKLTSPWSRILLEKVVTAQLVKFPNGVLLQHWQQVASRCSLPYFFLRARLASMLSVRPE